MAGSKKKQSMLNFRKTVSKKENVESDDEKPAPEKKRKPAKVFSDSSEDEIEAFDSDDEGGNSEELRSLPKRETRGKEKKVNFLK